MILCVTLNPALDRTLVVRDFARGGVFRPQENMVAAGGKGINVARAIRTLGGQSICAGFLGGFSGQSLAGMVRDEGMQAHWTWLESAETRTCVILVDPDTLLTSVINEPGPQLQRSDWTRLSHDLLSAAAETPFVCFCGSLPPGSSMDLFVSLITDLIAAGKQVWVDTSGVPLEAVSQIPGLAIKINDEEAAALMKHPIHTLTDAVAVARQMNAYTGQGVVITLGKKGAVFVNGDEVWHASPPNVTIKSGVGSGDSFLAGLLAGLSRGESAPMALAQATAAGTANAMSIGGGSFTRTEFEDLLKQVQIVKL
jgi:1-phosphofructokinase family hexose kinase